MVKVFVRLVIYTLGDLLFYDKTHILIKIHGKTRDSTIQFCLLIMWGTVFILILKTSTQFSYIESICISVL